MSTKVIAALIIGALSTITATAYAAVAHAAVTGGKVQGGVTGTIASFKGIPFAAPPVGANRWRSPEAVVPWSGGQAGECDTEPAAASGPGHLFCMAPRAITQNKALEKEARWVSFRHCCLVV